MYSTDKMIRYRWFVDNKLLCVTGPDYGCPWGNYNRMEAQSHEFKTAAVGKIINRLPAESV
jgi:hypothetical protein